MAENQDNSVYLRLKEAFKGQADARIAERLKVSRSAVSQWKRGENQPDAAKLIRAEEITGLPLEWFLTGDEKFLKDKDGRLATPAKSLSRSLPDHSDDTEVETSGPMTPKRFIAELQALGVEDFHSIKSMKGLTSADMEEIIAVIKNNVKTTAQTMVEQKIKTKKG